jgi:hypothetical protein
VGGPIDGSTITCTGPPIPSGTVTNGTHHVDGLASGHYTVTIDGPRHVQNKNARMGVRAGIQHVFVRRPSSGGAGRFRRSRSDSPFGRQISIFKLIRRSRSDPAPSSGPQRRALRVRSRFSSSSEDRDLTPPPRRGHRRWALGVRSRFSSSSETVQGPRQRRTRRT